MLIFYNRTPIKEINISIPISIYVLKKSNYLLIIELQLHTKNSIAELLKVHFHLPVLSSSKRLFFNNW